MYRVMQEQLVSFETAKLAKEKGFNLMVTTGYVFDSTDEEWILIGENSPSFINNREDGLAAPTQSLLQKWLREVHNLYVNPIEYITPQSKSVMYELSSKFYDNASVRLRETLSTKQESLFGLHNSYEECLEYGLFEALKLI